MSEPTRQQIKEAFNKTIERWEKIVEDPSYYIESHCSLCYLTTKDHVCHEFCPIQSYTKKRACGGSPYSTFFNKNTKANALAELNFLRKVYIWWMEGEEKDKKEEKKEEWMDITRELTWKIEFITPYYYVGGYYKGKRIVNLDMEGIWIPQFDGNKNFKVERDNRDFRIFKKT